ncbi:MAG: chorismate mutase [Clostridia bacterium]
MENGELERLRGGIDRVDAELVTLLNRRLQLVDEIAALKHEQGLPVRDEAREAELLARIRAQAGENAAEAEAVYQTILRISRMRQEGRHT